MHANQPWGQLCPNQQPSKHMLTAFPKIKDAWWGPSFYSDFNLFQCKMIKSVWCCEFLVSIYVLDCLLFSFASGVIKWLTLLLDFTIQKVTVRRHLTLFWWEWNSLSTFVIHFLGDLWICKVPCPWGLSTLAYFLVPHSAGLGFRIDLACLNFLSSECWDNSSTLWQVWWTDLYSNCLCSLFGVSYMTFKFLCVLIMCRAAGPCVKLCCAEGKSSNRSD